MGTLRTTGEAWKGVFQAAHPHSPFLGQCPPPDSAMFNDFVPKIKTHPVGWHIPIFYEYPPAYSRENVLRTDYLGKTVLIMNENDHLIHKDFDTLEPEK